MKIYYSLPDQICRWGDPPVCLSKCSYSSYPWTSKPFRQLSIRSTINPVLAGKTLQVLCDLSCYPWGWTERKLENLKENLKRRNKCRGCLWVAERPGSILRVTQWEICLWDSGEEQKLCAINQNRSFSLFLNTVYSKAALGWKHMWSLETNHGNKSKKKNKRALPTHPCSSIPLWDT